MSLNHDWFICASGQSLTQADVDAVRGKGTVVVINNTFQMAPWADVLWACDKKWWLAYPEAMNFKGRKISLEFDQVEKLPFAKAPGLGLYRVHTGSNSGYQAINFAFLEGAKRIILLGYDMHGTHWHGRHKAGLSNIHNFEQWIENFNQLAADLKTHGVEVINCTRQTKLKCFRREPLESVIS